MKDLGETQYILGIKVLRDRKNRKLALSQATYINKILLKYVMQDSKKGLLPFKHGIPFLRISVLKKLRRKSACSQYPMPLQWVVLCMWCYVLGQIFTLKWLWWVDINLIQVQNIGQLSSIYSSILREWGIMCLYFKVLR